MRLKGELHDVFHAVFPSPSYPTAADRIRSKEGISLDMEGGEMRKISLVHCPAENSVCKVYIQLAYTQDLYKP